MSIGSWWSQLALREKRLVAGGGAVVGVVLVYLLLWEPAAQGIAKLRNDLPGLRAQNAAMRQMADEAAKLRRGGIAQAAPAADDRMAAVQRSLDRAGLARGSAGTPAVAEQGPVTTLSTGGAVVSVGTRAASAPTSAPEVSSESGGRVRVRFASIDYGVWVAWVAATESELSAHSSRVVVASLAPDGPPGRVKVESVFDWTPAPAAARS